VVVRVQSDRLVVNLGIVADGDSPVARDIIFFVPGRKVILASEDEEGWDRPANNIDSLDNRHPLAIAWLNSLRPASSL
jgi:hypothetical protein